MYFTVKFRRRNLINPEETNQIKWNNIQIEELFHVLYKKIDLYVYYAISQYCEIENKLSITSLEVLFYQT